ncbi:MAG TPA: hypothetical protein VK659_16610 [Asanoa sp.]|nr:hypothetical protein [Asanoa sp.]
MSELERRYRWLLRAYPRSYREYRADEILEILLAEQPRRLSMRESWALVLGGLRERAGANHLDAGGLRRSSLRLAALALLILDFTLHSYLLIDLVLTPHRHPAAAATPATPAERARPARCQPS